jgi:hypothetical protein
MAIHKPGCPWWEHGFLTFAFETFPFRVLIAKRGSFDHARGVSGDYLNIMKRERKRVFWPPLRRLSTTERYCSFSYDHKQKEHTTNQ